MPLVDMPLEKLQTYKGTNPRPADFDQYWETALTEMRSTDPQVTMIPAKVQSPNMECYDLYFTGVDHARIHVRHVRPRGSAEAGKKLPAVLMFHGYGGSSPEWSNLFIYPAEGFAVFSMDTRGQGGYSEELGGRKGPTYCGMIVRGMQDEDPQKLYFRNVFLDTAELANIVMGLDFIDESRVYAKGGSQGGGLTVACAALEPRISRAVPVYPFLTDYRRVWDMDLTSAAYDDIRYHMRYYDPTHEHETEFFTKLGYIDVHHLAPRIKADVLMFTGMMDTVCPPSTQFAVYNNLNCRKKHILYPDFGHEYLFGNDDITFDFLVNDKF